LASTTKYRPFGVQVPGFHQVTKNRVPPGAFTTVSDTKGTDKIGGTQVTTSEGHAFRFSKLKGKSDIGGDFFTQKKFFTEIGIRNLHLKYSTFSGFQIDWDVVYSGPLLATNPFSVSFPPDSTGSTNQLNAAGATAIANVKPGSPIASLTAALIELRNEGLPHVVGAQTWRDKTLTARNAGSEYLNVQFGYKPLVSDVTDFGYGVTHSSAIIQQYKNGVGRLNRRRYDFPETRSHTTTLLSTAASPYHRASSALFTGGATQKGALYRERRIVQNRWFSGAFTYYFPYKFLSGKIGDAVILAQQLGLEMTPEVLWQVAPWSWAVDWFSNTGDVISNWTSFHQDGLVMCYGYMMEHTIVTDTYSLIGAVFPDGVAYPVQDLIVVTETKKRLGATPYGFGLNIDSLSGFQKSILAALGFTKFRR